MIKKHVINTINYLAMLLLIVSCDRSTEVEYIPPEFKKTLSGEMVAISEPLMCSELLGIEVFEDKIVVIGYIEKKVIHIYDKTTGQNIKRLISIGRAGNEVLSLSSYTFDHNSGEISLYDGKAKKIVTLNITDNPADEVEIEDCRALPSYARTVFKLDQNKLLQFSYLANREGMEVNRLSLMIDGENISNNNKQAIEDPKLAQRIYGQSRLSLSQDKSKFVIGTVYGGILETYSVDNDKIESLNTSYLFEPHIGEDSHKAIYGFSDIAPDDEFIYTAYNGTNNVALFNNIAIFDWAGNPCKIINFEGCEIVRLCVDGSDNIFALANIGDGDYRIVKTNLRD